MSYDNIPANTTCTVTEPVDGSNSAVSVVVTPATQTVTIGVAGSATAGITDEYSLKPGSLVLTKTIAGDAAGQQGAVTIHLVCSDGVTRPDFVIPAGSAGRHHVADLPGHPGRHRVHGDRDVGWAHRHRRRRSDGRRRFGADHPARRHRHCRHHRHLHRHIRTTGGQQDSSPVTAAASRGRSPSMSPVPGSHRPRHRTSRSRRTDRPVRRPTPACRPDLPAPSPRPPTAPSLASSLWRRRSPSRLRSRQTARSKPMSPTPTRC